MYHHCFYEEENTGSIHLCVMCSQNCCQQSFEQFHKAHPASTEHKPWLQVWENNVKLFVDANHSMNFKLLSKANLRISNLLWQKCDGNIVILLSFWLDKNLNLEQKTNLKHVRKHQFEARKCSPTVFFASLVSPNLHWEDLIWRRTTASQTQIGCSYSKPKSLNETKVDVISLFLIL